MRTLRASSIFCGYVITFGLAVIAYCDADETGKALIEATGVAALTVEAKYTGPSSEADGGWDF